jgi:nitrogen fixation protein FixH
MKTKRNLWPLGVFIAFSLFFTGMASVVVIAATHRDSMVNANYYEQELKFQGQIDAVARGRQSGATIALANDLVTVTLPATQLAPKLSGTIQFYRPSATELDREFPLAPNAVGLQTLDVSGFAAGLWRVRVKWNTGGQDFFLEQKIIVTGK